jgi:hypothetical protein
MDNSVFFIENNFHFSMLGTKKALQMFLESPLTRCGCIGIIMVLERAARPSGCSKPGTLTRQSLVPGFSQFFYR